MKVLFVCTGNTCRSPMAEGIFREMMVRENSEDRVICESAGLSTVEGMAVADNAVKVCGELDIDISGHMARKLTGEDIPNWDIFFAMSKTHGYILEKAGVPHEKIYVSKYIDDPFMQDIEVYRKCRQKLEKELELFYNDWIKRALVFERNKC